MSPAAKYREIANALRVDIDSGALAVGDRLPTEPELRERFDASRTTVRQALDELRSAGVIDVRQGVGAFVTPPRTVKRLDSRERLSRERRQRGAGAFLAEASEQGFTPSSSVNVWFEPAGEYAELLGMDPDDEVCVRDRVMRADGKPVMLATSRLPREITRGTALEQVETGSGGAHARLEDLGYPPTWHEEVVSAPEASEHERRVLDIGKAAMLHLRRTTKSGDRIVEINDMRVPATEYELRYSWEAD